jgi:Rieske Fe-S protein
MTESHEAPTRRGFFTKVAAILLGGIAMLIPSAAGLTVLLDPLRRKSKGNVQFLRVTTLDAVPVDGSPRKFPVVSDRVDAWSKFPKTPIGAVYLQRKGETVIAFNVRCPHAGCFVDAVTGDGFHCPCHNSKFNLDGSVVPGSVSPRGLDELEVDAEALKQGIVQVRFQNFAAGTAERIART